MQHVSHIILIGMMALFMVGCAHYPLGMSEAEWNRLSPAQKLEARKEQAALDQQRALEREKLRLEREALEVERARKQRERDLAEGMIHRFGPVCFGGSRCPDRDRKGYVYSLGKLAYVDKVVFTAHDNIGNKHGPTIDIRADDKLVAEDVDIKRNGSTRTIFVGKVARNIVVSIHSDDEVEIEEMKVFGQYLDTGEAQILIIQ